jgi:hypothetical protein
LLLQYISRTNSKLSVIFTTSLALPLYNIIPTGSLTLLANKMPNVADYHGRKIIKEPERILVDFLTNTQTRTQMN